MGIVRVKHKKNFTVLPNELLNDQRLDWRTLGLLCYLLSKPSDWVVSATMLAKMKRGNGRNAIYDCLNQMKSTGYAQFEQPLGEGGVFKAGEWVISSEPLPEIREPETASRKPVTGNGDTTKERALSSDTKEKDRLADEERKKQQRAEELSALAAGLHKNVTNIRD